MLVTIFGTILVPLSTGISIFSRSSCSSTFIGVNRSWSFVWGGPGEVRLLGSCRGPGVAAAVEAQHDEHVEDGDQGDDEKDDEGDLTQEDEELYVVVVAGVNGVAVAATAARGVVA